MKKSFSFLLAMGATVSLAFGAVNSDSSMFAEKAAKDGMAEVVMGQLAQREASSPEVKALGEMLEKDHSKANDQLKSLAQKKGMTLPGDMGAAKMASIVALGFLEGHEFDMMFLDMCQMDHEKAVDMFKSTAQSDSDADIKAFAAKTLRTLEDHLAVTGKLRDAMH